MISDSFHYKARIVFSALGEIGAERRTEYRSIVEYTMDLSECVGSTEYGRIVQV